MELLVSFSFIDLKQIKLPTTSPAKMGIFRMGRELHSGICNHGDPHARPHMAREGEHFYRGGKEVGSIIVNKETMIDSLPGKKRSFSSSVGLCYHCKTQELLLPTSQLYLLEVSVY